MYLLSTGVNVQREKGKKPLMGEVLGGGVVCWCLREHSLVLEGRVGIGTFWRSMFSA